MLRLTWSFKLTAATAANDYSELGTPTYNYSYTYANSAWGDLLTSYKGHSISYDEIGNPDNLYVNGHDYVMTWTTGRRLAAMTNSAGNEYYTFTYNDEGIRTSKTAYGVTHKYLLSGSQIIAEDLGDKLIVYLYDENGSPMGMQYRTSSMAANTFYTFWFEKNLQGDIIAVYNESGTKLISYTYDAWGNVTQTVHNHAGSNSYAGYNPFRYRGYYYDTETKLYYLNSRYYNPEIGRFINADGQLNGGLLGYNQFAYCENNPVNRVDPDGHAWWHWAIAAAVVVACAAATVVTCGGSLAGAAAAIAMVAGGSVAFSTASTVAAAATIGSATVLAGAAFCAAANSSSISEFNANGNWGTVIATVAGAVFYGGATYATTRTSTARTQTTTVYRSVSNAEAQDIKNTGRFNLVPGGMECKQFGFNLSETREFGNRMGQSIIVSAEVPTNMIDQFYTGGVDTSIFRSGTMTVYDDQLEAFNQAVSGTIRFYQ